MHQFETYINGFNIAPLPELIVRPQRLHIPKMVLLSPWGFIRPVMPIFHQKMCLRWVPNAREYETNNMKCIYAQCKPNPRIPNANYIPLAHVGSRVGHYRLTLGTISWRWALLAHVLGLRWVRKAFQIPTCWYSQREIVA